MRGGFDEAVALRGLLDHLDQGVLVVDADDHVRWANAAAAAILGSTVDDLVGMHLGEAPWRLIDADGELMRGTDLPTPVGARTGEAALARYVGVGRAQDAVWVEVRTRCGEAVGGGDGDRIVTLSDVTARLEAERELWSRIAFEDTVAGVSRWFVGLEPEDADEGIDRALADVGTFLAVDQLVAFDYDPGAETLVLTHEWSARADELRPGTRIPVGETPELRKRLVDLTPFEVSDTTSLGKVERDHLAAGAALGVPMIAGARLTGCLLALHATPRAWTSDAVSLLAIIGELVSSTIARRRATEIVDAVHGRLRRANADLEDLNRELIRANDAKDEFLSVASHELRSPLVSITGFTETLTRRWDQLGPEEQRRYVEVIGRQARRLHHLVDDLLETSRISSGHIRVEPESHLAVAFARTVAEESLSDVEIAGDPSIAFYADGDHVRRILTNLIENAAKYGRPPIRVTVAEDDEAVHVRVLDHGDGVPEDFVPRLFERFARAQPDLGRGADVPGTGLGLSIVRDLAVLNGGGVRYESGHDGACFVVRLPRG